MFALCGILGCACLSLSLPLPLPLVLHDPQWALARNQTQSPHLLYQECGRLEFISNVVAWNCFLRGLTACKGRDQRPSSSLATAMPTRTPRNQFESAAVSVQSVPGAWVRAVDCAVWSLSVARARVPTLTARGLGVNKICEMNAHRHSL
eukprot:2310525-Rhodomonas_salina.1